ncbi:MAG: hypothetical protein SNF69_07010 [Rikenellaceae bacterium]
MPKKKIEVEMTSYGIYTPWELITMLDGKEIARMKFTLFNPNIIVL